VHRYVTKRHAGRHAFFFGTAAAQEESPLRIPAGGAAAAARLPPAVLGLLRSVPIQRIPLYARASVPCGAPLSSYTPVRSPLALRAVSCRAVIRSPGRGADPNVPYHSQSGLPGETKGMMELTAPPGRLLPLAWSSGHRAFVSSRGRARPAPWTPKARVHSPSSLPPEPPIPSEWLCRQRGGPQSKFEGKGGLRAPCGKDYPPNPPQRSGRTNWGVRGHGWERTQLGANSTAATADDPVTLVMNPPPDPLSQMNGRGKAAAHCLQPNKRLTMSSHQNPVAAHRKPALFAIVCPQGSASATTAKTAPPRSMRKDCYGCLENDEF
jgi:hypothetical protein